MPKFNIEDYTVDLDNMNATVYYNYLGEDRETKQPKPMKKLIGYYSPDTMTGTTQAIKAILRHNISLQKEEMDLQELLDFSKLQEGNIKKWVKEVWLGEVVK